MKIVTITVTYDSGERSYDIPEGGDWTYVGEGSQGPIEAMFLLGVISEDEAKALCAREVGPRRLVIRPYGTGLPRFEIPVSSYDSMQLTVREESE